MLKAGESLKGKGCLNLRYIERNWDKGHLIVSRGHAVIIFRFMYVDKLHDMKAFVGRTSSAYNHDSDNADI